MRFFLKKWFRSLVFFRQVTLYFFHFCQEKRQNDGPNPLKVTHSYFDVFHVKKDATNRKKE